MIVVVDYGRGNLFSLGQALRSLGAPYIISDRPEDLATAERIIFPGVGAFADAMQGLNNGDWSRLSVRRRNPVCRFLASVSGANFCSPGVKNLAAMTVLI